MKGVVSIRNLFIFFTFKFLKAMCYYIELENTHKNLCLPIMMFIVNMTENKNLFLIIEALNNILTSSST